MKLPGINTVIASHIQTSRASVPSIELNSFSLIYTFEWSIMFNTNTLQ